jgi:hypothetical protein
MSTSTITIQSTASRRLGAQLDLDAVSFREKFNREPIGYSHNLSGLDLFKLDLLRSLAEKMDAHPKDCFMAEREDGGEPHSSPFRTFP